MLIEDKKTQKRLFYAPGLGEIEPHLPPLFEKADCIMVDGTFWTNTEMMDMGLMTKKARDIGHNPQSGEGGMIEVLDRYPNAKKVLIHINNTNPILREDSKERQILTDHCIEVAYDGMDIVL
jgi:pyrroloquinoline quinone biosynthesis protein B